MKTACLAAMISLMTMVCFGCGGGGSSGGGGGSSSGGGGSSSAGGGSSSAGGGSSSAGGGSSSAVGGSSSAGGGSSGGAGSSGGGGGSSGGASASASKTDSSASSKPLSIEGNWLFLGPTGPGHEITITSKSIKYKATETDWESNWTIKTYDNDLHHFQIVYDSGSGDAYPSGENFSATFDLNDMFLSIQLAKGLDSYPKLDSEVRCTDGLEPIPDCKLYMKMQ